MEELELVKALLEQNRELTQQVVELAKEAMSSRVPAPVLAIPDASKVPLYMSEGEEDLHHKYATGQLDKSEYENALKELEFFSSEITVPTAT